MAFPFANAGLDQFGQNFSTSNNGNFLAGLAVQKSGLEDYLNKNFGVSYSGGKLSEYKKPEGSVAPNVNPYANTEMPANQMGAVPPMINPANSNDTLIQQPLSAAPPVPSFNLQQGGASSFEAIKGMGQGVLDAGKALVGFL